MGREIRRVPFDFDWPLNKTWDGFLTPERLQGEPCQPCNGSGQTHFGWWLQNFSYVMGMLADDVRQQERGKPMHPWLVEFPRAHGHWKYPTQGDPKSGPGMYIIDRPTPDALEFFARLMDTPPEKITGSMFGANTHHAVMTKLLEITGVSVACTACDGHGSTEKYEGQRAEAEAWEPTGPPEGPGWQLWETVSEGSPISPVFTTADGLARWMSSPAYTWGAVKSDDDRPTYEAALRFIEAGWAPSFAGSPATGLVSGVEWVGSQDDGGAA